MGSVLNSVGQGVGSIFGNTAQGLGKGLGAFNGYQAQSPYSQDVLQDELDKQAQIYGGQQSLAQALQQQAAGQGPNPAQTMFQANQQSNIANAQGLIASQRGLNPALAARIGANTAAQGNQQAALGSALLQQQQQLAATANLGNLYGQMQQGNLGYQKLYVDPYEATQKLNYQTAAGNAATQSQMATGLMNQVLPFAGKGASSLFSSGGGGGAGSSAIGGADSGAAMAGGPMDAGGAAGGADAAGGAAMLAAGGGFVPGRAKARGNSYSNDNVPAMLSPGEGVIDRESMQSRKKAHSRLDEILDEKDGKRVKHDARRTNEFARAISKITKNKGDEESGYGAVIAARRKRAS